MEYGWFIRGKRTKLFVGVQGSVLRAFERPADATVFPSCVAAQAFADSVVMAPDLEVVDMAIHDPLPPDTDQTVVPSLSEVIQAAKDEDRPREAQRAASWKLIQKAVVVVAVMAAIFLVGGARPATSATFQQPPGASTTHVRPIHPRAVHALRAHVRYGRSAMARGSRARGRGRDLLHGGMTNAPFSFSNAVAVAETYLGSNPTGRASLWCADFANLVERQLGRAGTKSREALSFLHYGPRVVDPRPGDIVVLGRRGGGHVGYLIKQTAAGPEIISGNHGHRVGIGVYNSRAVIAYVRPS